MANRLRRNGVTLLWLGALLLSVVALAGDLDQEVNLNLPAESLSAALRSLAKQADLQISFLPQDVEGVRTESVVGNYSARNALTMLLKGENLIVVEQAKDSVVVRRDASGQKSPGTITRGTTGTASPAGQQDSQPTLEDIVVTARKQSESLVDVPESITTFSQASIERLNLRSFADYATKAPNLSFSYGTNDVGYGDSRSVAIRGISGANTVGIYLDDTPLPDSIDPRVIDIDRIEVLKGPQGTLYGSGSMGGNLRMISVQPVEGDHNGRFSARLGHTSGAPDVNYSFEVADSQNLIPDHLTARLVGFVDHSAGYLTRTYPGASGSLAYVDDQGAVQNYGGSLALLWRVSDLLRVTTRILYQHTEDSGWAAPYAPLPAFRVTSLTLNRTRDVAEGTVDYWYLPTVQINYDGSLFHLASSTSYFDREVDDIEDGTEGTGWALSNFFGFPVSPTQPIAWNNTAIQRRTTHETRISFDKRGGFSGVVGIYLSDQHQASIADGHDLPGIAAFGLTNFPGYCSGATPCPSYNTDLIWYSNYPIDRHDRALFGELYYDWGAFEGTLGARAYQQRQHFQPLSMGALNGSFSFSDLPESQQNGVTPKLALSYKFSADKMVYASASKGYRGGGENQPVPGFCGLLQDLGITAGVPSKYDSDSVWNYEFGSKLELAEKRLLVTGALFQMNWNHIQQSVSLPTCFLYVIANEGAARARGAELEITAKLGANFDLHLATGYDDAKITEQGTPGLPAVGARVAQVPRVTSTVSGTYSHPIADTWSGFISVDYTYIGDSISNTSSLGYPLIRPSYELLNASIGINHASTEVSLYGANLTNERPNLGDINPISYVRHDGAGPDAPVIPRVGTLPPLTFGIQFRQRF